MTDLPIDPAAAVSDEYAPLIAADTSSLAERIGRQAENHITPLDPVEDDD